MLISSNYLLFICLISYFTWINRKSAKATVVLFPLLGMTYLIFAVNPEDGGGAETAYHVVNAFLQSTQVSSIACIYLKTLISGFAPRRKSFDLDKEFTVQPIS